MRGSPYLHRQVTAQLQYGEAYSLVYKTFQFPQHCPVRAPVLHSYINSIQVSPDTFWKFLTGKKLLNGRRIIIAVSCLHVKIIQIESTSKKKRLAHIVFVMRYICSTSPTLCLQYAKEYSEAWMIWLYNLREQGEDLISFSWIIL